MKVGVNSGLCSWEELKAEIMLTKRIMGVTVVGFTDVWGTEIMVAVFQRVRKVVVQ